VEEIPEGLPAWIRHLGRPGLRVVLVLIVLRVGLRWVPFLVLVNVDVVAALFLLAQEAIELVGKGEMLETGQKRNGRWERGEDYKNILGKTLCP